MRFKKHSLIITALAGLCLMLLNGCNAILSRDYMVITPHLENRLDEEVDDEQRAETFQELKDSILRLVEEGYEVGIIRLYNYAGDVDEDTEAAITYTMRNQPLGAYAVEYVSYKSVRILSYYERTLTITYRKTPEEIASIKKIDNFEDYRRVLLDTYSEYGELVTVEIPWFYSDQYSVTDILREHYVNNPLMFATAPSVSQKEFPDVERGEESGWRRILEISFNYFADPDELYEMTRKLVSELGTRLSETELPGDDMRFLTLKNLLIKDVNILPDPEEVQEKLSNINSTAYSAVINGIANSEGFALAYKALCDMVNIDCLVVQGRRDGLLHSWNLVVADDGEWYHIDTTDDNTIADGLFILFTDEQMSDSGYRWDSGDYPSTGKDAVSVFIPEDTTFVESEEEPTLP